MHYSWNSPDRWANFDLGPPSHTFMQVHPRTNSVAQQCAFVLKPSGRQTLIWPSNHTFMPIHARIQCRKTMCNWFITTNGRPTTCCQRHYLSPRSCLAGGKQYNIGQSSSPATKLTLGFTREPWKGVEWCVKVNTETTPPKPNCSKCLVGAILSPVISHHFPKRSKSRSDRSR